MRKETVEKRLGSESSEVEASEVAVQCQSSNRSWRSCGRKRDGTIEVW